MDTRTAVDRCLTNVMALGYNPSVEAALEEICDFRFFGEDLDDATLAEIRTEMVATNNTFVAEVAAYAKAHELLRQGISPDEILEAVRPMVLIANAYTA